MSWIKSCERLITKNQVSLLFILFQVIDPYTNQIHKPLKVYLNDGGESEFIGKSSLDFKVNDFLIVSINDYELLIDTEKPGIYLAKSNKLILNKTSSIQNYLKCNGYEYIAATKFEFYDSNKLILIF